MILFRFLFYFYGDFRESKFLRLLSFSTGAQKPKRNNVNERKEEIHKSSFESALIPA